MQEYHQFFRRYCPDRSIDQTPFHYSKEQIDRSYHYNHTIFRPDYLHLGIFLDSIPIGSFQLKRIDLVRHQCEIGLILRDESVRNKGYGTEAIRQGLLFAIDRYGINRVLGETLKINTRMQRVFEKLGFNMIEEKLFTDPFYSETGEKMILLYEKRLSREV